MNTAIKEMNWNLVVEGENVLIVSNKLNDQRQWRMNLMTDKYSPKIKERKNGTKSTTRW